MKKLIAFLLMIATVATCFTTACGDGISEEDKKNSLIIEAHSAGYGEDWIAFMAQEFEQKTGTKVIVEYQVGVQGISNMDANIKSLTSDTDIFFTGGASFSEVYRGSIKANGQTYDCLYADLTDLYNSTIEGEGITVAQKMTESSRKELLFNDKYYHFPYVSGMQGFIRNIDEWEDSWTIPRTTNELFELCDVIKASKAPFIYSLSDEYWTSMLAVFVSQYEGVENMEKFWQGYGPDGKRYSNNMIAHDGVLKALEFFHDLLIDENGYMHPDSIDTGFTDMQSMFLQGQAVFNCNGDWLENEMKSNYKNAKIEMIKLPVLSAVAEKCSFSENPNRETILRNLIDYVDGVSATKPAEANDDDVAYIREARSFERAGSANCAIVPSYSNQIETAKEFLKFIASNRGLEIFRDATNGCRPPFDYSGVPEASESTFRQSVNAVIAKSTNYGGSQKKDKIFSIGEINADLFNNNYGRFVGVFAAKNKADYHNALEYYMAEVKAVNDALNNAKIKAGV